MDQYIETAPFFSIIMPAYNASRYIEEAINSVVKQTYKHWELIVIDDGSIDNTAQIVKKLQFNEKRIVYHYQENKGLGAARNAGLNLAKTPWIAFLDADDIWFENKLKEQAKVIEEHSPGIIFSNGYYLDNNTSKLTQYDSLIGIFSGINLYQALMENNNIPVLSACIKKKIIIKIGLQDEHALVKGCEDWDYWLRACFTRCTCIGMDARLFKYRVHEASMSANRDVMRVAIAHVTVKNYRSAYLTATLKRTIRLRLLSSLRPILRQFKIAGVVKKVKIVNLLLKLALILCKISFSLSFTKSRQTVNG